MDLYTAKYRLDIILKTGKVESEELKEIVKVFDNEYKYYDLARQCRHLIHSIEVTDIFMGMVRAEFDKVK